MHQIAQQVRDPAKLSPFMKIVAHADGCIATTPEAAEIYQRVRSKHNPVTMAFITTPYPIEDQRWDFSVPGNEQSGIFIGTREWDTPSRNHFAALLIARQVLWPPRLRATTDRDSQHQCSHGDVRWNLSRTRVRHDPVQGHARRREPAEHCEFPMIRRDRH